MKSFQKFVALIIMIFVSKPAIAAPQKAVHRDSSNGSNPGDSVALGESSPSNSNATITAASIWEPEPMTKSASNAIGNVSDQIGTASGNINPVSVNGQLQHGTGVHDIETDANGDISVTNIGSVGNQINTVSGDIKPVSVNGQHGTGVHDIETDANGDISVTNIGSVGNQVNTTSGNIDPVSVNGQHGAGIYDIETTANPSPPGGDISVTTIGKVGNQVNTTSGNIHPISINYT